MKSLRFGSDIMGGEAARNLPIKTFNRLFQPWEYQTGWMRYTNLFHSFQVRNIIPFGFDYFKYNGLSLNFHFAKNIACLRWD